MDDRSENLGDVATQSENIDFVVVEPTHEERSEYTGSLKEGGVFRFGSGNRIVLDPAVGDNFNGQYVTSHWVVGEIYSGLMRIDEESGNLIQPNLAEMYEVDASGRIYEFTLRPNLKFSDGSPVTASDFKWSWERALKPQTGSVRASDVLGLIDGANEVLSGSATEIEGVVVIDERVLRVTLADPRPDFLALLADPVAVVLKRENVEKWGIDWATVVRKGIPPNVRVQHVMPVGTGPFKMDSADFGHRPLVLRRNDYYHDGLPNLDGLEIIIDFGRAGPQQLVSQQTAAFENRMIDMMFPKPVGIDYQEITVNRAPSTSFLIFNSDVPPFDDVHFRRSLAMASDTYAHGVLPLGFPGFNEQLQPIEYDPDMAREEFSRSRYADQPLNIRFNPSVWGFLEREFRAISEGWSEVLGIEATYQPLDVRSFANALDGGELQIMGFQLTAAYPDPNAIFGIFNDPFKTGAKSFEASWVAGKLREANIESDTAKRLERYAEIEQFLIDQALVIPIEWGRPTRTYSAQTWVNDFKWPQYGGSKFKDVWFDETAPERELP